MPRLILVSTLICPACGYAEMGTMPTDACQYLYECSACRALHKPKAGDCCVYCSYGSVPCPPKQSLDRDTGGKSACCR
ncbi:MAG TPA: GDCCVxC domain-containing (seleno)protein [Gammaproteobacteria bacterium]|jgi:hypothetical protein|nr:GDCCVxC domain-containing (seleno)protein [Gammaproteobacteria bacterium]